MSRHLKPLLAPKFWGIAPKSRPWVVKPVPGAHKKFESIPLTIILRDILKVADTANDASKIIKSKQVLVDEKIQTDPKFGVGLMDVIHFPKIKKSYRIIMAHAGLKMIEIPSKETNVKLCRINRKNITKNKRIQLGLHDGRSILLDAKSKETYKTGDTLLIELPTQKIVEHLKAENGKMGIIMKGENRGKTIKIKSIKMTRSREQNKIVCELEGRELDAVKDDVFVVGETKPVIKIME